MDYDVITVGAGPAGATFARCADKALKILMLDGSALRFGEAGNRAAVCSLPTHRRSWRILTLLCRRRYSYRRRYSPLRR